ncbi:MAG: diguanylate cyclase [Gallionella sp.]|nr:diguanylate cyclase [Gallionella sp.]
MCADGFCRVLLVEDDPADANLVSQMLRASSQPRFEVSLAEDLAGMHRQLSKARPDVLLLDLSLPDSSGLQTVQAGRHAAGSLPLVVLTGYDDTEFAVKSLEAGAQDYLVKGNFNADGLVRAIRYAVSRAGLEQNMHEMEERWRFALEGSGDGVWDWNVQSGEVLFSRRWKEMLGYREDEISDKVAEWESRAHPEDKERVLAALRAHLEGETISYVSEHRLRNKNGEWIWILDRGKVVSRDVDGKPLRMIGMYTDITERKRFEDRIRHMAQHDALTDLPNRALFSDRLQQALSVARRDKLRLAVMFLDLDKFKPINDTLGHDIGDLLLKEVAQRMQACMRESDTVARIGGDEFVVLLRSVDAEQDALVVAEKIRAALDQPFLISGNRLGISCSAGIALYPDHGSSELELSKNADAAMYAAKQAGRNRVELYRTEIGACSGAVSA